MTTRRGFLLGLAGLLGLAKVMPAEPKKPLRNAWKGGVLRYNDFEIELSPGHCGERITTLALDSEGRSVLTTKVVVEGVGLDHGMVTRLCRPVPTGFKREQTHSKLSANRRKLTVETADVEAPR
jgi:hypothetical protein